MVVIVDEEALGTVAMAAACWVMGLPMSTDDERKTRRLAGFVDELLGEVIDEDTGRPVALKAGWWRRPTCDEDTSWTGIDGTDIADPNKVWRCDGCGATGTRDVLDDLTLHLPSPPAAASGEGSDRG